VKSAPRWNSDLADYRQTIQAYPNAGGAYIVTKDNFGLLPAQFAGVALLTDYILTVAVSILSESVLAFLNLSVKNNVSWGRIIAEAYQDNALTIGMAAWIIVPGLCIVFLVFGFYLFGYALDEILNPRLRRR